MNSYKHIVARGLRLMVIVALVFSIVPIEAAAAQPVAASQGAALTRSVAVAPTNLDRAEALRNQSLDSAPLAPDAVSITATKRDALVVDVDGDTRADPGDTLEYTVVVTNSGSTDATAVQFNDTLDANTTLVGGSLSASPVAANDLYSQTVVGNVSISSTLISFSVLSNDYLGLNPPATITAYDATSTNGGNVVVHADGTFTYNPPAGFEGTDTFSYTLSNSTGSNVGVVSIPVSGMIWFINNNALSCTTVAAGCGRLSNPFSTLTAFNSANGAPDVPASHIFNPAANDNIFVYESASAYSGAVTLLTGQKLIGQDATASLSAITGLTPPSSSADFPVMSTSAPATTIQNGTGDAVTVGEGNTIRGLTISSTSGAGIKGVSKNALTVGSDVALTGVSGADLDLSGGNGAVNFGASVTNTAGRAISIQNRTGGVISLTGAISDNGGSGVYLNSNTGATITFAGGLSLSTGANAAFTATGGGTVNATQNNSSIVNVLATTTGAALNVANTTIGASGLTFRSISSNGATNSIVLNNAGAGGLTVVGNGGTCSSAATCTGGSIQNSTGDGISLSAVSNLSFDKLNIENTAQNGIQGTGVVNFSFVNSRIFNAGTAGAGQYEENLVAFNDGGTFTANTLSGVVTITGNIFSQPRRNGIDIETGSGTISNIVISNNTFTGGTTTGNILHAILVLSQGSAAGGASITTGKIQNNTVSGFEFLSGGIFIGGSGIFVAGGNTGNSTSTTLGMAANPIEISGNDVDNVGSNGIIVSFNGINGAGNFNIHDNGTAANPMSNMEGLGISVFFGGNGLFSALVNNNAIDNNGPTVNAGSAGIGVQIDAGTFTTDVPNANITVNNNIITNPDGFGIRGIARNSNGILDLTIKNNQVGIPSAANRNAIRVDSGSGAGDTTLCLDMTGNTGIGGSPNRLTGSGVNAGIGVRKQGTVATVNDFGFVGISAAPTNAQVQAFVGNPNNLTNDGTGGSVNGVDLISGSNYSSCTQTALKSPTTSDLSDKTLVTNTDVPLELSPSSNVASLSAQTAGVDTNNTAVTLANPIATNDIAPVAAPDVAKVRTNQIEASPNAPQAPDSGETINVTVGTLPANESLIIKFRASINNPIPPGVTQVSNQGTISGGNFASVLTDDPDTGTANDPTVTPLDVQIDLQVTKTVNPVTAYPGLPITYTITYLNAGPQASANVVITDPLPSALTGVAYQSSATITPTGSYVWTIGALLAGQGGTITVTGLISSALAVPATITNTATITGTGRDTNISNNTASVGLPITDLPISGLNAINNSPTLLGSATNFTATVTAGTNVVYQWNFGDGSTGSGATAARTYVAIGTYTATVTATNSTNFQVATTVVIVVDVPIAGLNATSDSPTRLGNATSFTATINAGSNVAYAWDFGDGTTGSGATPAHTYTALGTYTATVTATNGTNQQVATTVVTVIDQPISGLTAVNDSPTQMGNTTHFTATISGGTTVTYQWDFGDGFTGSSAITPHIYDAVGSYVATVTATNGVSVVVTTTNVSIVDVPITGLTAANSSPTVLGNSTAFTATISGGSNVTYQWNFGDGSTGNGANTSYPYAAIGTYTATVTATNGSNTQVATTVVTIFDTPIAGLTATSDSPTRLGNATNFTATTTGGSGIAYAWDFGDGVTGSGATPPHTYAALGTYTATVTATNSLNSQTASTVVVVIDQPIQGLSAINDSPTRLGSATNFTATIGNGTNITYQWNFGDGFTGSGANDSHTYGAVGSYVATVTATNSVSVVVATTNVSIIDTPIVNLAAANDSPTQLSSVTSFIATIDGGSNVTYQWNFGDGSLGSGANDLHTYSAVGSYVATVTATNGVSVVVATTNVSIIDRAIVGLSATNSSPTGLGNATIFTATISDGTNVTYAWNFGDGFTGSGANAPHTYSAIGTYTATVTATNGVSVVTASTVATIVNQPISGLSAANSSPTRLGSATNFTATVATGSTVTYAWDFGDGAIGGGVNASHPYAAIGTYTATVTATNVINLQTASTVVVVIDRAIVGLSANNDSPTRLGSTTAFTATIGDGSNVTYQWNFGDGSTVSGANSSHTYGAVGAYVATVTATNGVSMVVATTNVSIIDTPIVNLTAANSSPTGLSLSTFVTATIGSGSNVAYAWNFGDGSLGSDANASHVYPALGAYTATVTATNGVSNVVATTLVTIVDQPLTTLSATSSSPTLLGNTSLFTATANGTSVIYTWNFGDDATGGGANASHTYTATGLYTAIVTATNSVGSLTATLKVNVFSGKTYLPLIARNYVSAPDLVVTSLRAGTGNVQVVIKNQGDLPATDGFYVDVYINPYPAPTAVNQIWSDGRSAQGLTWGVTSPMQPGQVLTLTIGDAYYLPDYSVFTGTLPIGTPVYAQVDSFDPVTTYGTVRENHEIVGAPYNNILGPVPSTAAFAPLSAERPFVAGKYWLPVRLKAQ